MILGQGQMWLVDNMAHVSSKFVEAVVTTGGKPEQVVRDNSGLGNARGVQLGL